ncbi:MAG: hypothetical protein II871_06780 [Clostridia bacterium]|nr:hypothetical protein [Clostridia bacterium]
MKKKLKAALAAVLALCLALAAIPVSALPSVKSEVNIAEKNKIAEVERLNRSLQAEELCRSLASVYEVPDSYSSHDYYRIVAFLENSGADGIKNGKKLMPSYAPEDIETWDSDIIHWSYNPQINGDELYHLDRLDIADYGLFGMLYLEGCVGLITLNCGENDIPYIDVSNCINLSSLYCGGESGLPLSELYVFGCNRLRSLTCTESELTELDLSDCAALYNLTFSDNNMITELDLSGLTNLDDVRCYNNALEHLNVSNCVQLRRMDCRGNRLIELDVSSCNNLREMQCSNNKLTEIDLRYNQHLPYVIIRAEGAGTVGYDYEASFGWHIALAQANGGATFLGWYKPNGELIRDVYRLDLAYTDSSEVIARFRGYNEYDCNKIVSFLEQTDSNGVKNGDKLSNVYDPNDPETWNKWVFDGGSYGINSYFVWEDIGNEFRLNGIGFAAGNDLVGTLDVSGCTELETMLCAGNRLNSINASGCSALNFFNCSNNINVSLNLTNCVSLETIECDDCGLTSLNLPNLHSLRELSCKDNNIVSLNVSGCSALHTIECQRNRIPSINLAGCTALSKLSCDENELTSINLSQNTNLRQLDVRRNKLTALDVSNNSLLNELYCNNNELTELDVSNNRELISISCQHNKLTSLHLENNDDLPQDLIVAEGNGTIGYFIAGGPVRDSDTSMGCAFAEANDGATFIGWFNETGELLSAAQEWIFEYVSAYGEPILTDETVFIARFSDGSAIPGDVDGSGTVTTADAITTLRLALQLIDGSGLNSGAVDMDSNGSITIADAILVLRVALGLA